VVVPVYNEGENAVPTLRGLVEKTHTRPLEVLVVHDFEEDTTVPVVKRLQSELPELHLHRNELGRGVLNALKSGLAAAKAPYVLVTMGDGSDNPVAGLSLHWLGGLPIHDATSNYRLYSKRLLQKVTIESTGGFELGLELTVKAYALGMRVAEVPTTWRDRTAGESRFKLWKWLPRYLHWYWRGMAGRFSSNR
jgi:glycosyltransferase involved in cell wall biosynthesis